MGLYNVALDLKKQYDLLIQIQTELESSTCSVEYVHQLVKEIIEIYQAIKKEILL